MRTARELLKLLEEQYERIDEDGVITKEKDVIDHITSKGWKHVRTEGSHRIFKHPNSTQNISVPTGGHKTGNPFTLKRVIKNSEEYLHPPYLRQVTSNPVSRDPVSVAQKPRKKR